MLNITSILDTSLHYMPPNNPYIISYIIIAFVVLILFFIILLLYSILADSYGTYLSWCEPTKLMCLNLFRLLLWDKRYSRDFRRS